MTRASRREGFFRNLLDRSPPKDETGRVQTRSAIVLLVVVQTTLAMGCGALLLGSSNSSSITFEAGELRSNEEISLAELDLACSEAVETLGYEQIQTTREEGLIRWTARTAGGEPVDLQLARKSSMRTELRIRIGVLGNEAKSRLVLEQIHQSL
jgi:hypothetical protein